MDKGKLLVAFEQTTNADAAVREAGETTLNTVYKIAGFAPLLLEIALQEDVAPSVRQSAVIFLKNCILKYWDEPDETINEFTLAEQDKVFVREHVIDALQHASEPIRNTMCAIVEQIVRKDFPTRWPTFAAQVMQRMKSDDGKALQTALLATYKLVKCFEYRKTSDKQALFELMKHFLPLLHTRMLQLIDNDQQEAVFLQKLIIKIIFSLIQHSLNLKMISGEDFLKWVEVCRLIMARPVPEATLQVDEEERDQLVWHKCKKWAMFILARVFERYGTPGQVGSQYETFAKLFMEHSSTAVLETTMGVLDMHRHKVYVAPRVLFRALSYVQTAVTHASTYKIVKPHVQPIIRDVIFPLMKHTDADEELWTDDPKEYIKEKYDIYEEMLSPSSAACQLLASIVKRRTFLPYTVDFIVEVLNSPEATPADIDAVLHMIGEMAEALVKAKRYKNEIEKLLIAQVVPRIKIEGNARFLRARSCWVMAQFCEANMRNKEYLKGTIEILVNAVVHDDELPVKVEAALAIQMLLAHQDDVEDMLREHVRVLVMAILELISTTEQDDLTAVMDQLINRYIDQIVPIAIEVAKGLTSVFISFLTSEDWSEERTVASMGIMGTLETILGVMEEHAEVMVHLEGIVLDVVNVVMERAHLDFYEEVLSLIDSLTTSRISPKMWQMLPVIHEMFKADGTDFFNDFMPVFHNYLTVDTPALVSDPSRAPIIIDCARIVLEANTQDDMTEAHAAKLLECTILQLGSPHIDAHLAPIISVALARLAAKCDLSELRVMLLQVLIAALYTNTTLTLSIFAHAQPDAAQRTVMDFVIRLWLDDTDCFLGLHDRKLSVLGLCKIMSHMPLTERPAVLCEESVSSVILANCISLLNALQGAYADQAAFRKEAYATDEESGEEEDGSRVRGKDDGLASDEDDIDDDTLDFLEAQQQRDNRDSGNEGTLGIDDYDSDDDDDSDYEGETDLEAFNTPIDVPQSESDEEGEADTSFDQAKQERRLKKCNVVDEFIVFRQTMEHLAQAEPQWFAELTVKLTKKQRDDMTKLFNVAELKQKVIDSTRLAVSGGYKFNAAAPVPTSFNFSSQ